MSGKRERAQVLEILALALETRDARRVGFFRLKRADLQLVFAIEATQTTRPAVGAADDGRFD